MHVTSKLLDQRTARLARELLTFLRSGQASARQQRYVRWVLRYYVAPWDIIPDAIPGVGLLDDYLMMLLVARLAGVPATQGVEPVDVEALAAEITELLR